MFRKIVSNLAFSPALVGQLGFYAKRLRKEEATRRVGLIFTALALVVQSFAVFSPPESANAANPSDFIRGGVSSLSEYMHHYDQNSNNIKDIFTSLGITRSEIQAARAGTINSKGVYSWGMTSHFSAAQGEGAHTYQKSNGTKGITYYRPLSRWDSTSYTLKYGSTYDSYIGYSKNFGWFALIKSCGNLATKKTPPPPPKPTPPAPTPIATCSNIQAIVRNRTLVQLTGAATASGGATISKYIFTVKDSSGRTVATRNVISTQTSASADSITLSTPGTYKATLVVATSIGQKIDSKRCATQFTIAKLAVCSFAPSLPANSPDCQPCAGDSSICIKDEKCDADIIETKSATNLTQSNDDATSVVAQASNKIAYKITTKNIGLAPSTVTMNEKLSDVMEYASLVDNGGAKFDKETATLSWPEVTLQPGQERTHIFVIQLADTIPAVAQGKSDKTSYDCMMTNTFGNTVEINVNCPVAKHVERTVSQLPHTGASENIIFAGIVLSLVTYFYARTRQVKKEVRLIRRNLNAGTI